MTSTWPDRALKSSNIALELPKRAPSKFLLRRTCRLKLHQLGGVLELTASGVNVAPARAADESRNAGLHQDALKCQHTIGIWGVERNFGAGIQRDQVHLRAQSANQVDNRPRVLRVVVDLA